MTHFALALVLTAAFFHATWNLLAKRVSGGGEFVWLFSTIATIIYAPLVVGLFIIQRPNIGFMELIFIGGSGALHLGYFLMLQRGYRTGDLSLVYPLARGTGPVLATIAAITLFGERPTPVAFGGAMLVGVSVFMLTGGSTVLRASAARGAAAYGLITGMMIACYTLWDKHAVSALLIPPLLLDWASGAVRAVVLAPVAGRRWHLVKLIWRTGRWPTIGVAVLSPLSYILVLTALVTTPVSYVAPAREVSILIGTAMGARLLAEGDAPRRLAAAGTMVVGVVALALR